MKTMCPQWLSPQWLCATHALRHMMYGLSTLFVVDSWITYDHVFIYIHIIYIYIYIYIQVTGLVIGHF